MTVYTKELRDFIQGAPALMGLETEFVYAARTIESSIGILKDFGIIGEPFSGKRQFCRMLKRWMEHRGYICDIRDINNSSQFNGDIVFLLDSEPYNPNRIPQEDARRKTQIGAFSSNGVFVVYTSTRPGLGAGETMRFGGISEDDSLRILEVMTGYKNGIMEAGSRMMVPLPESLLIVKSICNRLIGERNNDAEAIGMVMSSPQRTGRAMDVIPPGDLKMWRGLYGMRPNILWMASRCGMRYFIPDEFEAVYSRNVVECGLATRNGPGLVFSEAMCALSYGIWGEPDYVFYRYVLDKNIQALESCKSLPQMFYDDAIRQTEIILEPELAFRIGLDKVLHYIMELIRHRVYDKNKPLSCIYLVKNSKSLKHYRKLFADLEANVLAEGSWDPTIRDAVTNMVTNNHVAAGPDYISELCRDLKIYIAREIKATVHGSLIPGLIKDPKGAVKMNGLTTVKLMDNICTIISKFSLSNQGQISQRQGCCDEDTFKHKDKFWKLFDEIREEVDRNVLDIDSHYYYLAKYQTTRTTMGFQKTLAPRTDLSESLRQTTWVHLLWDEFEVNARWFNIVTINGYAESSRLIDWIHYINETNRVYPLCEFKPVNEEIDFSSIAMYAELLNPKIFELGTQFEDPKWYMTNYGMENDDRSVIYLNKSKIRIDWENAMGWKDTYGEWKKNYEAAEKAPDKNDELMLMNLRKDLFHYHRLYCEMNDPIAKSELGEMEMKHRSINLGSYWDIYALITLELSRAELLCDHVVKSQEYLGIVKQMEARGMLDPDAILYRASLMDTEARIGFRMGAKRSAIRQMEDLRRLCLANGLVSQYVITGVHLLEAYGSDDNDPVNNVGSHRIEGRKLRDELRLYSKMLVPEKNAGGEKASHYRLVRQIILKGIRAVEAEEVSASEVSSGHKDAISGQVENSDNQSAEAQSDSSGNLQP